MKIVGFQKAQKRAEQLKKCLDQLRSSRNHSDFEEAWTNFLLAHNAIFTILEQSAKHSPQSRQWYGRKKNERRKDPLLQYLHQARNADEHGIEPITVDVPGSVNVIGDVYGGLIKFDGQGRPAFFMEKRPDGTYPDVVAIEPHARLVAVKDERFGDIFQPPKEHAGSPIEDDSPIGVATLSMNYVLAMIEEAKAQCQ